MNKIYSSDRNFINERFKNDTENNLLKCNKG